MAAGPTGRGYTLGELAAAAGMTARNVRAYQTRGLLAQPTRVGRRSLYHEQHLHRLTAIRHARLGGATLTLIANHLAEGGCLEEQIPAEAWLPRPRQACGSETMTPRTDREDVAGLLSDGNAQDLADQVRYLIEVGVLERDGRRLLADPWMAGGLAALGRSGTSIRAVLDLVVATAELVPPLAQHAGHLLAGTPRRPPAPAGELADLVGRLVRELVHRQMSDGAGRRPR